MRTFLLALLVLTLVGALAASAQEPLVLNVDVSLVTLDVIVTDASGRPVTTLKKDDFTVYENGVQQEIRNFTPVESPYSVLLLIDCSTSTQPLWPFLVESMNRFTARLRPQDNIALAQFGGSYKTLLGWRARGSGSVEVPFQPNDRSCNNTDFYGAIGDALAELRRPMGRKGAVVLTDGVHNGIPVQRNPVGIFNRRVDADDDGGFQKVLRAVRASDAVLYFVAVNTDLNPAGIGGGGRYDPEELYDMLQVRSRMEQLAQVSGGRMTYPKEPADVVPLFEQIGQELGTSYGLGYEPPDSKKDGTYRKIEVRLNDKNLRVQQSRTGYEAR